MRTHLKLSVLTLAGAVAVSACSDARATDADSELKRDLELASSTVSLAGPRVDSSLLNVMETKPQGAPEAAPVVKKGPGPRAVRSRTPTVRATPEVELAEAEAVEEAVETLDEAPAPEEILEPVAIAPRPQPVIVQTGGTGDYGTGNGGVYGGGGGVWGTGGGVIIRGGGVDGDNCELHRRGRGTRGPIFVPSAPAPTSTGTVVRQPTRGTGIGIGSRQPGRIETARERVADRTPSPSSSRGTATTRGILSPRGR